MRLRGILLQLSTAAGILCGAQARADETPLLGPESEAHAFLKGLPREWAGTSRRDCKTYEEKNIDLLSASFAMSAARFLKAFVELHGKVTITSAHRTAQEQTCVCDGERGPCAGRPRIVKTKKGRRIVKRTTSHHQQGIALDIRAGAGTKEEFACLHEFARFNPHFGIHFPMGARDQPHMEPLAVRSRSVRIAGLGLFQRHVTPCAKMQLMLTDAILD